MTKTCKSSVEHTLRVQLCLKLGHIRRRKQSQFCAYMFLKPKRKKTFTWLTCELTEAVESQEFPVRK